MKYAPATTVRFCRDRLPVIVVYGNNISRRLAKAQQRRRANVRFALATGTAEDVGNHLGGA
ncbi:MAG: hypothetical protein KGJ66_00920 [Alphaproteobacteria bacterium]|nr:hypothetical protein [Alphaproteobacteria bacterium]